MTKNITLRLEEMVLRKARHVAVEQDQSLSQWVQELIERQVGERPALVAARRRALKRLENGLHLGGSPLTREGTHER